MKSNKLLLPVLASLTLLVGCSKAPKLSVKNETVTKESGDTYQSIFNKLYDESGVSTATKELLVEVADYVLDHSSFWTASSGDADYNTWKKLEIHNRIVEKFDEFYVSTNKEDGFFKEELLAQALRKQGYTIGTKDASNNEITPFEETITTLKGLNDLYDLCKYDYSDWEKDQEREIKLDLLKEEYIRTQKGTKSDGTVNTTYYTNKKIREVQYFSVSIDSSADRLKYSTLFADKVTDFSKDLKTEVNKDLEVIWKTKKLEDLAKEFAMINIKAHEGNAVCEDEDYPLPTDYVNAVKAAELKTYDDKYKFRDIYGDNVNNYTTEEIKEVTDKLNTYTNNGTQSMYKGYYLKQLEIITTSYLTETVYSTDKSNVINTAVTTAIKNFSTTKYGVKGTNANNEKFAYIDPNKADDSYDGNKVYRDGTTCYVIQATKPCNDAWADADSTEAIIKANRVLAETSSNVSNCWYYYLTELNDSKQFEVNWKAIYESLNETYSYGEKD